MAIVTTDNKHYKATANRIRSYIGETSETLPLRPDCMADAIDGVYAVGRSQGYDEGAKDGWQAGFDSGKLEGIEQGIETGKTTGKIELLQDSKYMNAKASGTVVALPDVSPLVHDVQVVMPGPPVELFNEELTLTFPEGSGCPPVSGSAALELVEGKEYIVTINGEDYTCTAGLVPDTEYPCYYLGWNLYHEENRGLYPFGFFYSAFYGNYEFFWTGEITGTSFTCQVVISDADGGMVPATFKCYGANVLDTAKVVAASNSTTLDGDVLTTTFANKAAYINIEWVNGKPARLPAGTYTFTLVPVSDTGMVCTFYVYNKDNTILFTQMIGASNGVYSFTFTAKEEFRPALGGYQPYGDHSYKMMLTIGSTAPAYEPYTAPTTHTGSVPSKYPFMALVPETEGVLIDCSYLRDIDRYIDNMMMNVALTGGE